MESIQLSELEAIAKYSTLDIVKATGIPIERLRDWLNRGYIEPTLPSLGQGRKALFSDVDIYAIELFQKLIARGFSRHAASELIKNFTGIGGVLGATTHTIFVRRKTDGEEHIDVLHLAGYPPQDNFNIMPILTQEGVEDVYIVNIQDIRDRVDMELDKLA